MSTLARLSVDVRGRARRRVVPSVRAELARRLRRAMRAAGVGGAEVSLSLVDDEEILTLNRLYADEDHATDVLSFSQRESRGAHPGVESEGLLGDIVISIETAARQAQAGQRSLLDELVHLAVHGLVHLLGFDHATVDEERVMFGYEEVLRAEARGRRAIVPCLPPAVRGMGRVRRS